MAPRPARLALLAVPLTLALALGATATGVQPDPAVAGPHPASSAPDTADDLPAGAAIADEQIFRITRSEDRIYATGYFRSVGRYAGPGQAVGVDGAPQSTPQVADGQISVAVSDGDGGWYLGGDFTRIGGHPAGGLAHVLEGGELDTGFLPIADRLVTAMALVQDTLYVGGAFTHVNGVERHRLAAVSTEDGSVQPFDAPQAAWVTELVAAAPTDGPGVLYVASDKLSALDLTTGAPVAGFFASTSTPITALELGGGRLYVGTDDVVALDPATGAAVPGFDLSDPTAVDASRGVYTLLYTADRLYVGADRAQIGDQPGRLVAVDPGTGAIDTAFAPDISTGRNLEGVPAGTYDLALDGDHLWVGGSFAGGLTVVDSTTGAPVDIDLPSYNLQVNAVELAGTDVYVGGHFYMTGASRTHGLAAFDADTLDPVPGFHANTNAYGDVFVGAGAVWVAETHFLGYDPSKYAATSGEYFMSWTSDVSAFDPDTGARITERSLRVKNLTGVTIIGDNLYVARRLQNNVRFPRNRIDVYGPTGKRVDGYVFKPHGYITQLSSVGRDLVVAGSFVSSRDYWTSARSMFRVNPANGRPRYSFDPHTNGPVYDVASSNGGLIATGLFNKVEDTFAFFGKRPGLTRMGADGHSDRRFDPRAFRADLVLARVQPLGDLLWVDGSSREFLDARTGQQVADPTGLDGGAWWVTGTAPDLSFTSMIEPNLGGRTGFKLAFVANAG